MITLKEYLIETDINTYKKIIKNFRINSHEAKRKKSDEKLSEYDLQQLMSHSSYKRHKGAIRQVNQYGR